MMRKPLPLAEVLAATGEEIDWKGRTLHALVSDNPLSQDLGLGGFEAKGDCTMKVLRSPPGDGHRSIRGKFSPPTFPAIGCFIPPD